MQVVVPSVSRAAVLHGLAGTTSVETPSGPGLDKPVVELGACSAMPCTADGAGADCPVMGGEAVGGPGPRGGSAGARSLAAPGGAAPPVRPEPWASTNPTGRMAARRASVAILDPAVIMVLLPGSILNRSPGLLVPAISGWLGAFLGAGAAVVSCVALGGVGLASYRSMVKMPWSRLNLERLNLSHKH
jgi:hypothetical protein